MIDIPAISVLAAALALIAAVEDPLFGPFTLALAASSLYHLVCELSPLRATVGKYLLGLTIVTSSGHRPGPWRVALRTYLRLVSWFTAGVPLLMGQARMFGRDAAMLHDYVSGTRTIRGKALDAGDLRALQVLGAPMKSRVQTTASILAHIACALLLATYTLLAHSFAQVRATVTRAYEVVRPAMQAVDAFHQQHKRFPASVEEAGGSLQIAAPGLREVRYLPKGGIFQFEFAAEGGAIGAMFVIPVENAPGAIGRITWACGASAGLPPNLLPASCTSLGQLALRRLAQPRPPANE